ncbi:unnamed protein product [Staurois parvus]|uniref:Uncharacterized protein n=1 Tax=Staurois parvus TaxID=386267 RepID=A0ABN9AYI7_9NEOB|nr:unnamed protein product [Staurois parvus]
MAVIRTLVWGMVVIRTLVWGVAVIRTLVWRVVRDHNAGMAYGVISMLV